MFEKIVLHRSAEGPAITMGEIAEALLFYQNVHLVLDYSSLSSLIDNIGMTGILSLLTRHNVSAVYVEEMLATHTRTAPGGEQFHAFGAFRLEGNQPNTKPRSKKERLAELLIRKAYGRGDALRLAERFFNRAPLKLLSSDYFIKGGIPEAARGDLTDAEYISDAVREFARAAGLKEGAKNVRASIFNTPDGFRFLSNIDFDAVNSRRKAVDPTVDLITEASALCRILDARAAIILASHYGGEFFTSDQISTIVRLRYSELLRRTGIGAEELRELHDVTLPNFPRVREIINSGARSFDEFLALLERSQKFRNWIGGVNPDAKLVHEYLREVTSEGWIASSPSKLVRYAIATAVSVAAPVLGAVLSAADSLLIDRMIRGWRPSHFVEGQLKPFVGRE